MENFIKRGIFQNIKNHLTKKEITLITGARQVGKTTLMKVLRQELIAAGENTLFLNLDYEQDWEYLSSQDSIINKIRLEFGNRNAYVFIDEIQRKENAGLFLKGLYDLDLPYKFIVSGSGSLELKEKIHESLVGRKRIFELNPVSFEEFVNYKTDYKYSDRLSHYFSIEKTKTENLLKEYLNYGGYPRIVTEESFSEKVQLINEIFRSYIEKDIMYLLKLARPESFNLLVKLLAAMSGKILNYSKLAAATGISVPTLNKYLWYAEKTFIIRKSTPFFRNQRKEISKAPCIYFYDLGLRNYALNCFGKLNSPDEFGFVFQNFIYNWLWEKTRQKGYSLQFWRTTDKSEVDIVINKGNELLPVEVKFSKLQKPQIRRALRSFIEKYKPKTAFVVNLNLTAETILNHTTIKFLPLYKLINEAENI